MNFVKESNLQPEELQTLQSLLEQEEGGFQPSEVYNSLTEQKLIKTEKRTSEFRVLTKPEIFSIAKTVLSRFNEKTKQKCSASSSSYILYENDIMHIRYAAGGFFKAHEDYLSVTSNMIDEYTLLICANGTCVGGETLLHLNEDFTYKSEKTITPGGCLLFRKDINHEGSCLESGTKEIVSFNVWLIKEDVSQIMCIRFIDDERHVLLSADEILNHYPHSLLGVFLNSGFTADKKKNEKILYYDSVHSYDEFEVISKIYQNETLSFGAMKKYANVIDYYLLEKKDILSKAIEDNNKKALKNKSVHIDDEMIIFGSSIYYEEFLQQVKDNELPYVPFKVIFVEGSLSYGGGMTGTPTQSLDMMPVWCSFTEADHVMFHCKLIRSQSLHGNIDNKICIKDMIYDWVSDKADKEDDEDSDDGDNEEDDDDSEDNEDSDDDDITDSEKYQRLPPGEPFKFTFEDTDDSCILISIKEDDYNSSYWNLNLECCALDATNERIIKFLTERRMKSLIYCKPTVFSKDVGAFALDFENRSVLQPQHIEAIRPRVDNKFYEKIKANLNNIHIPNSQRSLIHNDEDFCNENVYGNFNMVIIYGFLKM